MSFQKGSGLCLLKLLLLLVMLNLWTVLEGADFIFVLPRSSGHQQGMARNPERLSTIITTLVCLCVSKRIKSVWKQCNFGHLQWCSLDCELQHPSHLQPNVPQQSHGKQRHWSPVNCFAVKPEVMTGQRNLGWDNTCLGCKDSLDSEQIV